MVKILAFAGSLRKESWNKKLLNIAIIGAKKSGAEVTLINLKEYPLPLYDQEIEDESGIPQKAMELKELFKNHDALLLACPEYNSSITGVLKNTIDWVSRPVKGEEDLLPFKNKLALLISASPGALGGLRGLVHVRSILGNIGVTVLPQQRAIPKCSEAFAENGTLKDAKVQAAVEDLGEQLGQRTQKWVG